MNNRINDYDVFSKLPLEVIGLILKKLDGDNPLEELKKCKLISPRLYKATQDLFQEEFDDKLCTHFDGSKLNYTSSRSFGMNIFGSYKLNFPMVKISWAEYYLMKSWLKKLIPTNIQTLEMKNNLLNWKEIVEVLSKFPKIIKLKYIQSSDNMIMADKIYSLYNDKEFSTEDFIIKMGEVIQLKPEFLPQLKIFEAEVIHWNIINILSLLLHFSQCTKLEKFALKVDLFGISESQHSECYSVATKYVQLNSLYFLSRFSKSMKIIEIIIDDSKLPQIDAVFVRRSDLILTAIFICSYSVMKYFSRGNSIKFNQLESLVLKSPLLYCDHILENKYKLNQFIRRQKNLENLEISYLDGNLKEKYNSEKETKFLKSLVNFKNKKIRFGYQIGYKRGTLENILQFSENLSALKVILIGEYSTWHFSDGNIPKFPNCVEMRIENFYHQNWDNYQFPSITEKFPNLEKLMIYSSIWQLGPKVFNQDFYFIISGMTNLKMIHFENSVSLNDSALTGLSAEAIEARKENPSEPVGAQDRIGLPISNLKNLESLIIITEDFRLEISDITAHHAFENMPKLKFLNLQYSQVTLEGFETILEKTGSKNLNILQLTTEQVPPDFGSDVNDEENEADNEAAEILDV